MLGSTSEYQKRQDHGAVRLMNDLSIASTISEDPIRVPLRITIPSPIPASPILFKSLSTSMPMTSLCVFPGKSYVEAERMRSIPAHRRLGWKEKPARRAEQIGK